MPASAEVNQIKLEEYSSKIMNDPDWYRNVSEKARKIKKYK